MTGAELDEWLALGSCFVGLPGAFVASTQRHAVLAGLGELHGNVRIMISDAFMGIYGDLGNLEKVNSSIKVDTCFGFWP